MIGWPEAAVWMTLLVCAAVVVCTWIIYNHGDE
jgi:hypothetical protein